MLEPVNGETSTLEGRVDDGLLANAATAAVNAHHRLAMLSISIVVVFAALLAAAIVCRPLHREEILARVAVVAVSVALVPLAPSLVVRWCVMCSHHYGLIVLKSA